MIKKIILAISVLVFIISLSGCGDTKIIPNDPLSQPGANEIEDTGNIFFYISDLSYDYATINQPYKHSFCGPSIETPQNICSDQSNPSGGNPPYHFVLESGVGFAPIGLILNPNGLLSGTPTTVGTSTFSVCAVDQSGKQACEKTTLEVKDSAKITITLTGDGIGNITDGRRNGQVCPAGNTCTFYFEKGETVIFQHNEDPSTGFSGFLADGCTDTFCKLTMDSDKSLSAQFIKLDATLDSVTCQKRSSDETVSSFTITAKGTAKGPKGTGIGYSTDYEGKGYTDPADGSDCGTWSMSETIIPACLNKGNSDTTSWTITHSLFIIGSTSTIIKPSIGISNGDSTIKKTFEDVKCG